MRSAKLISVVAATGLLAASSAMGADDATEVDPDIRCVVVAISTAESPDAAKKIAGTIAAMYFLGRIDALSPGLDLESAILDDLKKMSPEELAAEGKRCGDILTVRGAALTDMGKDMIRKGEDEMQKKSEQKS